MLCTRREAYVRFRRIAAWPAVCLAAWLVAAAASAEPALTGYQDYAAFSAAVQQLAETPHAKVSSLGRTLGGRDIWLITLSAPVADNKIKPEDKPAILIMGNVHAPHLLGSELALRVARQLAAAPQPHADQPTRRASEGQQARNVSEGNKSTSADLKEPTTAQRAGQLLERFTVYVIPRPNPDASEAFFQPPLYERATNERSTDDDRDGTFDEDPFDDLNKDGLITVLRVEDASGPYLPHPADDRVLIKADPKRHEQGRYRLVSEGIDNDHDEQFNEDPPGGVSLNRNFSFQYPFFAAGAGPHQVSEAESRAVADFAMTHPNIGLVFTFAPEDNLFEPWKPDKDSERFKTNVMSGDADHLNYLAEQYRELHGGSNPPDSPKGEGSFVHWAYFHWGRWSLGARGWWIPKTAAAEKKPPDKAAAESEPAKSDAAQAEASKGKSADEKRASDDGPPAASLKPPASKSEKRGAEDLNALRWFDKQGIAGFVPWQVIEHPDFPGRKVEVGGFKPFLLLNPPAAELDTLAEKHAAFLARMAGWLPQLKFDEVKVEPLGEGVFRLTVKVLNVGFLPTQPAISQSAQHTNPTQIKLDLPNGVSLVTGHPRHRLPTLAGSGGSAERSWLLRVPAGAPASIGITVYAAHVGSESTTAELK